jgi:O-antigen/teichoic acid export membrane protein
LDIIRSWVLAVVIAGLAYPLSRWYDEPELFWLLLASAWMTVLNGLASPAPWLASRDIQAKKGVIVEVVVQTVAAALSLLLAWKTRSVWALMLAVLAATLTRVAMTNTIFQRVPLVLRLEPQAKRDLLAQARWILVSTMMTFLAGQLDKLFVSKVLRDFGVFGLYTLAMTFLMLPMDILQRLMSAILFPAFSSMREQGVVTSRAYRRASMAMLASGGVLIAGIVATIPAFVQWVYKPSYSDTGLYVVLLAGGVWVRVMQLATNAGLLAYDDTKTPARSAVAKVIALTVLLPAALLVVSPWLQRVHGWGSWTPVACVAAAVLVTEVLRFAILAWAFGKLSGFDHLRVDAKMTGIFLVVCSVAVAGEWYLSRLGAAPWVRMLLLGTMVTLSYAPVMLHVARDVRDGLPVRLRGWIPVRPVRGGAAEVAR